MYGDETLKYVNFAATLGLSASLVLAGCGSLTSPPPRLTSQSNFLVQPNSNGFTMSDKNRIVLSAQAEGDSLRLTSEMLPISTTITAQQLESGTPVLIGDGITLLYDSAKGTISWNNAARDNEGRIAVRGNLEILSSTSLNHVAQLGLARAGIRKPLFVEGCEALDAALALDSAALAAAVAAAAAAPELGPLDYIAIAAADAAFENAYVAAARAACV